MDSNDEPSLRENVVCLDLSEVCVSGSVQGWRASVDPRTQYTDPASVTRVYWSAGQVFWTCQQA
jgi:hypothetical protein